MRPAIAKTAPATLLVLPLAWLAGAQGVDLATWSLVATVTVPLALLLGRHRSPRLIWRAPHGWLLGLLGWVALAGVVRPVAAVEAAYLVAVGGMALVLLLVSWTATARPWAALAVVVVGVGAGGWLVVQRMVTGVRPGGPFGSPNLSATIALLAVAVAPVARLGRGWRLVAAGVAAAGVLASGSRGALIGLAVAAVAWVVAGPSRRWLRWGAVAAMVVAAAGLVWRLAGDSDPLRYGRLRLWLIAARTIEAELPWGAGPGGYADAALAWNVPREHDLARFGRIPSLAESDALQLAATLGLPGLLLAGGLVISVLRRLARASPAAWGLVGALVTTSAVNTQLVVPVVAWSGTLALAAVLPVGGGRRFRGAVGAGLAGAALLGSVLLVALVRPSWWLSGSPQDLADRAATVLTAHVRDDAQLADAESAAWRAARAQPRHPGHWHVLGDVRLARASLRHEAGLAAAALEAFRCARRASQTDAWGALGEARALRLLGDRAAARHALAQALALEPRMVPALVEQGILAVESGDITTARHAVTRIAEVLDEVRGRGLASGYERALVSADPTRLARLRAGVEPGM